MGRLTAIKPKLAALQPRLSAPVGKREYDRDRNRQAWRGWYKLARWRRLRWVVLVRDLFTCQMCGRVEADTSKLVADHKRPHRGDERLFWDDLNLWCLCAPCHSGAKQRDEQRTSRT